MPTYLVERYWPGVTIERLLGGLRRSRQVMEQMSSEGTRLRHITTTLIPGEEVVLSVYEGPCAAAAVQLNERADMLVSRIVDAIAVAPVTRTRIRRRLTRPVRARCPGGPAPARRARGL